MPINGNMYDWESIEIMLPSGIAVGVTEISYNDERGIEPRYGKGSTPRGFGRKNYKATGSLTLDRDEDNRLRAIMGGTVYNNVPFPIVVAYADSDQVPQVDVLPDCLITKRDTSAKQDDDNAGAVKMDFVILSPIKWGGVAAYE